MLEISILETLFKINQNLKITCPRNQYFGTNSVQGTCVLVQLVPEPRIFKTTFVLATMVIWDNFFTENHGILGQLLY